MSPTGMYLAWMFVQKETAKVITPGKFYYIRTCEVLDVT